MGAVQEAADLARVYLHSVGMGVPEWAQRTFGDPNVANRTDAQVAQSRQNTGLAGDVANVAGYAAPLLGGLKALKALPAIARAAPAAIEAAPSALRSALATAGGIEATPAEAAARLGIPYMPTLAERALAPIGSAISSVGTAAGRAIAYPFVHPVKAAIGAAAVGIPALAEYASRNSAADAKTSVTPSAPAASAPAGPKATNQYDAIPSKSSTAATNPTFSDLAAKVAASQGGKLSLHDLSTLADVAYKTSPRQLVRQNVTAADMASQQALKEGNDYWDARMKNAKSKEEADQIFAAKMANLHEIGKASPYDPLGSMNYQSPDGN